MKTRVRNLLCLAVAPLLFGLTGCSSPPPDELFKSISDQKKVRLKQLLDRKDSELSDYKATVKEETDVDQRTHITHRGTIQFRYAVTRPEGEAKMRIVHVASAQYRFLKRDKKWVYEGCFLEQGGGFLEPKVPLVDFSEVKAEFEK